MEHTADKQLEHAEHVEHAAHDPLNRKIAMSMAIIAAFLAGAAMLSHRAHTETLRLITEANVNHTDSSDQWGFFQATNIRNHEYKAFADLMEVVQPKPGTDAKQATALKEWRSKIEDYEGKKGEQQATAAPHSSHAAEGSQPEGTKKGGKLGTIQATADALKKKARHLEHESHTVHHSVNWIDYGHLGLELALVLCSVAVLTKQRTFWLGGIGAAAIGVVLVLYGVGGLVSSGHL
jgi:hypothetical protein